MLAILKNERLFSPTGLVDLVIYMPQNFRKWSILNPFKLHHDIGTSYHRHLLIETVPYPLPNWLEKFKQMHACLKIKVEL